MPAADRPRSTSRSLFRFCPSCGSRLTRREGGGRARPTCPGCGFVQWRNPAVGVAAVIELERVRELLGDEGLASALGEGAAAGGILSTPRVLLVRRADGPRAGSWCIPCGYVEYDEEVREAVTREAEEETGLRIRPGRVLAVHSNFHDPDRQTVGIWFEAEPIGGMLRAGDDADRLGFFDPAAPGVPLAFPTDTRVLEDLAREAVPDRPPGRGSP